MTTSGFLLGLDLAPEVTSSKNNETAQLLRVLDVLPEVPGLSSSTHRTAHNYL